MTSSNTYFLNQLSQTKSWSVLIFIPIYTDEIFNVIEFMNFIFFMLFFIFFSYLLIICCKLESNTNFICIYKAYHYIMIKLVIIS